MKDTLPVNNWYLGGVIQSAPWCGTPIMISQGFSGPERRRRTVLPSPQGVVARCRGYLVNLSGKAEEAFASFQGVQSIADTGSGKSLAGTGRLLDVERRLVDDAFKRVKGTQRTIRWF